MFWHPERISSLLLYLCGFLAALGYLTLNPRMAYHWLHIGLVFVFLVAGYLFWHYGRKAPAELVPERTGHLVESAVILLLEKALIYVAFWPVLVEIVLCAVLMIACVYESYEVLMGRGALWGGRLFNYFINFKNKRRKTNVK